MSVRSPLGATPQTGSFELPARTRPADRDRPSSVRGLVAVAALLLTGAAASVAASQTGSLLPESIRPVPAALAGAFASAGLNLHAGGAMVVLTLMFVSYTAVVATSGRLSARAVLMAIAALYAFVLLAPPLASTDVFSYQAYGRMGALYATNPYLNGPHAIALDPIFPYIGAKWSYIPSAYGPVFTTLSYVLAPLSIAASVLAYKLIAVLSGLALVALVWRCARLRGNDPVKAVALVGLNPLLVFYGIGGGHNDLLMLVALVGSLYAILCSRERLGGGLTMVAIGIKLTAGLVLPFAIAADGPRRGRDRRRNLALGAGVGLALIAVLSFAVFGSGAFHLLATVQRSQSEGDWKSIPGVISTRLGMPAVGRIAGYVLAAAFVGTCCWLLRRVWQGRTDWIDGAGWATLAMLIASSSFLPWYVAWMLPLAALAHDRRLVSTAIVMTGVVLGIQLLGYIPHGSGLL
jgi:hypothetical protein